MPDNPVPANAKQPEYDAGHVPMSEEMDDARHSLPNLVPVVIALVVVAIIVAAAAYLLRAKPVAGGSISGVYGVEQNSHSTSFVAINVVIHNTSDKTLYIKDIKAEIATPSGTFTDDAASATDYDRYLTAYPDLRQGVKEPLKVETKIPSGGNAEGTVLVNFPINKDAFDKRTGVTVSIIPYDNASFVIHGK
jgi:fructose-specific component phosphotransferase system IIB-like protein